MNKAPGRGSPELDRELDEIVALVRGGEPAKAETALQSAIARQSSRPRVHAVHGYVLAATGRFDEASAAFERAIARDPDYVLAWQYLSGLRELAGDLAGAVEALDQVLLRQPGTADDAARRIMLVAEQGLFEQALADASEARARYPDAEPVQVAHGLALRRAGRLEEALAVQEAVLRRNPGKVKALGEKGAVLFALGHYAAAMEAYDAALEHDDDNVFVLNGLGLAEYELGMYDAALAAFDKVLTLQPWRLEAQFYRALTLEAQRRFAEALEAYELVLERQPDHALAYNNIGKILRESGRLVEALKAFERSLEIDPSDAQVRSNLLFTRLYDPRIGPDDLFEAHLAYGRAFGDPADRFTAWANDRDLHRRLKVGVVSAEFFNHALSNWLLPALEALDRREFDLVCYFTRQVADGVTERFKLLADVWRDVGALDDRELAATIRRDAIDILIDTTGHTAFNRLSALALHPAPVQATWLGYPSTTGLSAIDFIIMDPIAVRPGEEDLFVETVVRLPGGRFCYVPPANTPPVAPPPSLVNGWITFGSFNAVPKLTDDVLALWRRILVEVPGSRLVLQAPTLGDPGVARGIRERFCADQLSFDRLDLRGPEDQQRLLAQYNNIDIALDPFFFGGGLTTCETLWMGVPLVTLPGWQVVSRQSETCLVAIGRSEWVAGDVESYVRIARELAADPAALAQIRLRQRANMARSPLCDKARLGRELTEALRGMWRDFATSPGGH